MKNFKILLCVLLFLSVGVRAQSFKSDILGVRAGINIANIDFRGGDPDSKAGFLVGAVYERRLLKFRPLYVETGLFFAQKGCDFEEPDSKLNAIYLQIPLMVKYRFRLSERVTLAPMAGAYYAVGIGGNLKTPQMREETFDEYCKRSDFGLRFAAQAQWTHFLFSVGYEVGLVDFGRAIESLYTRVDSRMRTRNLYLEVGYNF